jgi:hypothetical protein
MNLKQRMKAIEIKLKPIEREKKIIVFSVVCYDDDTDLIGYDCNGLSVTRSENESLEQFKERAKTFFTDNDNGIYGGAFIFQPIYNQTQLK